MDHSLGTVALVILIGLGLVVLAMVVSGAFVLVKYRVPLRGIVAAVGALTYLVSPVDAIPEIIFGPFGYIDDGGILLAAAYYISRLVAARRAAVAGHPEIEASPGRRRRRS
ncbi:YkvA family protein [Pseudofrankia sp. DC12]|uniref:YkvA family protein n=1 Tax=Pseudofrankia sp. DC12 TaxID=683315 RepID=UPI0005F7CE1E|nr:YkvA family protein [Pseudofrankia sp. DC12]